MKTPWRINLLGVFTRDTYEKANAFDADGKKIVFDDAAILRKVASLVNSEDLKIAALRNAYAHLRTLPHLRSETEADEIADQIWAVLKPESEQR